MLTSKSDVTDQHAILVTHNTKLCLDYVCFQNITGYCWAWSSTTDAYSQNIKWNNVSALTVGGVIGSTIKDQPSQGRGGIMSTLFEINNFNLDQGINQVSPQPYICDWRGMRQITLTNFLLEGNRADTTANEYMIFDCDGAVNITNLHCEILNNSPSTWFRFTNSPGYYGDANQSVLIDSMWGASSENIVFESGSRAKLIINNYNTPEATAPKLDAIAVWNGSYSGSSVTLNCINGRISYRSLVPEALKGRLVVNESRLGSLSGTAYPGNIPPITSTCTPLFRWRAQDGLWGTQKTPYFTTELFSSYSTNEITTFQDTLVHQMNQTGARGAFIKFNFDLPNYLVGAQFTLVGRYYFQGNDDRYWEMFGSNYNGTTGIPLCATSSGPVNNQWTTTAASIVARDAVFEIKSDTSPTGSGGCIVNLAAIDVYLGGQYQEPLDILSELPIPFSTKGAVIDTEQQATTLDLPNEEQGNRRPVQRTA